MTADIVAAVADFQQVLATTVQFVMCAGIAVIVGFLLYSAVRVFRAATLAEKASKAERMRREEVRSRMQPRYTPAERSGGAPWRR